MNDSEAMQRAIDLARENVENGGWPFSTIITRDGEVLAEAVNSVQKSHDPSDHAEIAAIRIATNKLQTSDLSGCKMYVVGLPCPMCLTCMVMAKLIDVVYAVNVERKDAALSKLPLTDSLYNIVSQDYGGNIVKYTHLKEFSEQGENLFKSWNDGF